MRLPLLLVVLLSFTAYSIFLVHDRPFFEFITLAGREPWYQQVFLDLVISLTLFLTWARRDSRERGLPYLPYLGLTLLLGSIGALSYLVHREIAGRNTTPAT